MNIKKAKESVIRAGIRLVETGLIARTWGNVSCRVDEDTFVITPSGRDYLSLTIDEIVEVAIEDLQYKGSVKPSSEKGVHAKAYQYYPEVNFVIHTHQMNASVVSAMGQDVVEFSKTYPFIGNKVICAEYALPGTKELCHNAVEAMKTSAVEAMSAGTKENSAKAIILKHHGTICMGVDDEEAFAVANTLEIASEDYIRQVGGIVPSIERKNFARIQQSLEEVKKQESEEFIYLVNQEPEVVQFSMLQKDLRPLVDDFAQIVGIRMRGMAGDGLQESKKAFKLSSAIFCKGLGAICRGKTLQDAEAVSMILTKNCKSYFAAIAVGAPQYISPLESKKMRNIYLKSYSKLAYKK